MGDLGESFHRVSSDYDRGRPRYPREAVAAMLEGLPKPVEVVDIGAGTGQLARAVLGSMLIHIGDHEGRELLEGVIARDQDSAAVGVAMSCADQAQAPATSPQSPVSSVEYFRHYNVRA